MLYLRKKTIIFIFLSAVLTAGILSSYLPPQYETKTEFFVSALPDTLTFIQSSEPVDIKRKPLFPTADEEMEAVYLGILKSNGFRKKASLKVNKDSERLRKDTDFRVNNEHLIELYSRDKDPLRATNIANAYPEILNDFINSFSDESISEKQLEIKRKIDDIKAKQSEAEKKLYEFQIKNDSTILGDDKRLGEARIFLQVDMEKNRISLREIESKIKNLEALVTKEAQIYVSSPAISSNPRVVKLQTEISDLESSIASLRIDLRDSHPEVLKLKAMYNEKQVELKQEIEKIIKSEAKDPGSFPEQLRQQLVSSYVEMQKLKARETGLETSIKNLDERIKILSASQLGIENLQRDVSLYRETQDSLLKQLEEINAQEKRKMKNVFVVSPATVPDKIAFPNIVLNIIVAGIMSLLFGILYVFFLEYIDRVKDPERKWD